MLYYSTNKKAKEVSLKEAVIKGLASDKGLFMPSVIRQLPKSSYSSLCKPCLALSRCRHPCNEPPALL